MSQNTLFRGFTLIELLVVIAIIGLLSSIVITSVTTARARGQDSAAISNLDNLITEGNIYYNTTGNYGTKGSNSDMGSNTCGNASIVFQLDTSMSNVISAADKDEGGTGGTSPSVVQCSYQTGAAPKVGIAWAVYVPLNQPPGSNTGWCVDSKGTEKADTLPPAGTYACP